MRSRDTTEEAAPAAGPAKGAQVIDLADLLSRSIKVANKPGPAKAMPDAEAAPAQEEKADKGKGSKKKRATG